MRKGTALATALLALPICVPAQQRTTPAATGNSCTGCTAARGHEPASAYPHLTR